MSETRVGLQATLNGDRTKAEHAAVPVAVEESVRRALDTRIGLEDTLHEPDGERTTGNEALIRAASGLGAGND